MSFGWCFYGKNGEDLMKKYDISYGGLGLAPYCEGDTTAPYRLMDIRRAFIEVPYKDKIYEAARDALVDCQNMIQDNLNQLHPCHCITCTCPAETPNWDMEQIERFLSIPKEEVYSATGGY
jgi:hypothetical protein